MHGRGARHQLPAQAPLEPSGHTFGVRRRCAVAVALALASTETGKAPGMTEWARTRPSESGARDRNEVLGAELIVVDAGGSG